MTKKVYTTKQQEHATNNDQTFNWSSYFQHREEVPEYNDNQAKQILKCIREHLNENPFEVSLVLTKVMRQLLNNIQLASNLNILELGAATGFLSRWLLDEHGKAAVATLVDNNPDSIKAFKRLPLEKEYPIHYIESDLFQLNIDTQYNIVCSFGLVEHFKDKTEIIHAHTKHLKENGHLIILAPIDTRLNRVYWEVHQELNMGYRELLTEKAFKQMFSLNPYLKLISVAKSYGYAYDFIAGIAHYQSEN